MNNIDNNTLARYLCGEAEEQEKAAVEKWMAASPGNRREAAQLRESLDFVAAHYAEGRFDTDRQWKAFAAKHTGMKKRTAAARFRYITRVAAAVLVVVAGAIGIYRLTADRDRIVEMHTADASRTVFLPDSTEVTMAANSCLKFDRKAFGDGKRPVSLSGKAFFKVRPDTSSPFSVTAGQAVVTVLGTAFQVQADSEATAVAVEHGKVSFASRKDRRRQVILTAGMSAGYDRASDRPVTDRQFDGNSMAWYTGVLSFRSVPLAFVVETLEQHYGTTITLKSGKAEKLLTATFDNMSLDDVLNIINETLNVELKPEK